MKLHFLLNPKEIKYYNHISKIENFDSGLWTIDGHSDSDSCIQWILLVTHHVQINIRNRLKNDEISLTIVFE